MPLVEALPVSAHPPFDDYLKTPELDAVGSRICSPQSGDEEVVSGPTTQNRIPHGCIYVAV